MGSLFAIYRHRGFVKDIFTILLQIQNENFLPTSKHRQAEVRRFLARVFVYTTASFIAQISSFENVSK